MHNSVKAVLLLTTSFILASCSSTKIPDMKEYFKPDIREDESKMFTFTIITSRPNAQEERSNKPSRSNKQRKGGNEKGAERGGSNKKERGQQNAAKSMSNNQKDKLMDVFQQRLDNRIEVSQYCREGYFVLEKDFSGVIYTVRGECNESATARDRENLGSFFYPAKQLH